MNQDIERFTYRDGSKWARAEYDCRIFETQDRDYINCFSGELIDRLAELEDKLEQGTLIEPPYAINQKVYHISNAKMNCIVPVIIKAIHISSDERNSLKKDEPYLVLYSRYNYGYHKRVPFSDAKKDVFATESEAKAKLERRS